MIPSYIDSLECFPSIVLNNTNQLIVIDHAAFIVLTNYGDVIIGGENKNFRLCEDDLCSISLRRSKRLSELQLKKLLLGGEDLLLGINEGNQLILWGRNPITGTPFLSSPEVTKVAKLDAAIDCFFHNHTLFWYDRDLQGRWARFQNYDRFDSTSAGVLSGIPTQFICLQRIGFVLTINNMVSFFDAGIIRNNGPILLSEMQGLPPITCIAGAKDRVFLFGVDYNAFFIVNPRILSSKWIPHTFTLDILPTRVIHDYSDKSFLIICEKVCYVWTLKQADDLLPVAKRKDFDTALEVFGSACFDTTLSSEKKDSFGGTIITLVNGLNNDCVSTTVSQLQEATYFVDLLEVHDRRAVFHRGFPSRYVVPKEWGPGSETYFRYLSSENMRQLESVKFVESLEFGLTIGDQKFIISLLKALQDWSAVDWAEVYKLGRDNNNEVIRLASMLILQSINKLKDLYLEEVIVNKRRMDHRVLPASVLENDCNDLGFFV